jgi:hypothetical protein
MTTAPCWSNNISSLGAGVCQNTLTYSTGMPSQCYATLSCGSFLITEENLTIRNCDRNIYCTIHTVYTKNVYKQNAVLMFLSSEHMLELSRRKQVKAPIFELSGLMSVAYRHLLGHVCYKSVLWMFPAHPLKVCLGPIPSSSTI